jgi:hypothetical protein
MTMVLCNSSWENLKVKNSSLENVLIGLVLVTVGETR